MKKAIGGIVFICVVLMAFVIAKPHLFGEDAEAGNQMTASSVQPTEEPEAESVIASAVNPTKEPVPSTEQSSVVSESMTEVVERPTVKPTAEPTVSPTVAPTAPPTATPKAVEIPESTKVPGPTVTPTPQPAATPQPIDEGAISDDDIAYVAELLEVPEEKVREVIRRAEEAGYELDPDEIMNGNFDILGAWGIVTEVFGKKEATQLLFKVMKLGIFQ